MKSLISRIAIAVLIASFASVSALAKTKSETFKLDSNVKFNGTVLNKGVYRVKFDDQSGEMTISDEGGKVIARAEATLEKRDRKARQFMLRSIGSGDAVELIGVTFGGAESDVVVSGAAARR
jgi:type 1 fimbria pilin